MKNKNIKNKPQKCGRWLFLHSTMWRTKHAYRRTLVITDSCDFYVSGCLCVPKYASTTVKFTGICQNEWTFLFQEENCMKFMFDKNKNEFMAHFYHDGINKYIRYEKNL